MACDILLVEDNLDDLFLIRQGLAAAEFDHRLRHHVGGTNTADEIVMALRAEAKPDVLILDYHLPAWTAPELLSVLNASEVLGGVEVIVLGGMISPESSVALREMGANQIIAKPFDLEGFWELGIQVREACKRRSR